MTTAESFALAQWLDEYPDDVDYSTILEMIANGDDEILVIDLIVYEPVETIIRHIESTKHLFKGFTGTAQLFARIVDLEDEVKRLQDEICRLESALMDVPQ